MEKNKILSTQLIISDTNKNVLRNKLEIRKNEAQLKVIARIQELAKYQQGWYDGVEGIPATTKTIEDAIVFAKNLDFNNIYIPYFLWLEMERLIFGGIPKPLN